MFPDLRLLISATVVTFFLAAMAGLYASLRTQDQIVARTENRTATDENPITRISSAWPLPEPGRAAALRELARIANYSPTADRGGMNAAPDATRSGTPVNDGTAPDTTGSTGIAVTPEAGAVYHPDVQGNIGNMPDMSNVIARTEKAALLPAKKVRPVAKKKLVKRLIISARTPEHPVDLLNTGYPLYWTVPTH